MVAGPDCNATQRKHCMELGSQCNYHCCHRIPMEWQGVLNLFTPSPWFLKFHITPSLLRVFYYRFSAPVHGLFFPTKRGNFQNCFKRRQFYTLTTNQFNRPTTKGQTNVCNLIWLKQSQATTNCNGLLLRPTMLYQFPPNLQFSIFWNLLTLQS